MSADPRDPVFRLCDVSFRYLGRHVALDRVDLNVNHGECLVVLGANGSGKSTLLKVMDGLFRPASGRLFAFGEDITAVADDLTRSQALHRRVGLVFQDADVQLFSPTVWDDVAFGPLQMGWPIEEVTRRTNGALELMDVLSLAERAPYELSGGEKKRVAIASVLSLDPEVLLLDEPTANLDPRSKATLVDLIERLGSLNKTIIVSTQELEIVPSIASRVVVFGDREHRPVADGEPDKVLADTDLLVRANLVHAHLHYHDSLAHVHEHGRAGHHDAAESSAVD